MTRIEEATMIYLNALYEEFGESGIEITLPKSAYKALLSGLIQYTEPIDRRVYAFNYSDFTWNTDLGPIVVRRAEG